MLVDAPLNDTWKINDSHITKEKSEALNYLLYGLWAGKRGHRTQSRFSLARQHGADLAVIYIPRGKRSEAGDHTPLTEPGITAAEPDVSRTHSQSSSVRDHLPHTRSEKLESLTGE